VTKRAQDEKQLATLRRLLVPIRAGRLMDGGSVMSVVRPDDIEKRIKFYEARLARG
jgi:hypothetical protein